MFKRKKQDPDYWWKQYSRLRESLELYPPGSEEYIKISHILWEIIGIYIDSLMKGDKK